MMYDTVFVSVLYQKGLLTAIDRLKTICSRSGISIKKILLPGVSRCGKSVTFKTGSVNARTGKENVLELVVKNIFPLHRVAT